MLTKAKVEYNGQITWEPPAIYKSYCPIDIEFFPFDIQECFLKFGIWSYDFKEVDLQHMCSDKAVYINDTDEAVIDRGTNDVGGIISDKRRKNTDRANRTEIDKVIFSQLSDGR
jgi:hypothetical protein